MEKRVQVLESFAREWEPVLVQWRNTNCEVKDVTYPKRGPENRGSVSGVALLPSTHDVDATEELEDDDAGNSSDEEDSSDKLSLEDSDSKSDEDKTSSDEEDMGLGDSHPVNVVEPDEEVLPKISRPTSTLGHALTTTAVAMDVTTAADVQTTTKTDFLPSSAQVLGKGNELVIVAFKATAAASSKSLQRKATAKVGAVAVEKEKCALPAMQNRQTVESTSAEAPLVLDEEDTPKKVRSQDVVKKKKGDTKKRGTAASTKVQSKGMKRRK